MLNQNLIYLCILYQNGVPVGFIGRNGGIYSKADRDCIHYVGNDDKIHLKYHIKSYARESIRVYFYPYNYLRNLFSLQDVEEKAVRAEITIECC